MSSLRNSEFSRIANSCPWLFAEFGTLDKEYGWNCATFLWGWGNCIRECCVCRWIYGRLWYMYGGLACWFWLDNACEKIWTDLVMAETIAEVHRLNSSGDLANNSFDWGIPSAKSRLNQESSSWVFGRELKYKVFLQMLTLIIN